MADKSSDAELRLWYQQFGTNHDALKQQLMRNVSSIDLSGTDGGETFDDKWADHRHMEPEMLDEELRVWYAQFDKDHESRKSELVEGLSTRHSKPKDRLWLSAAGLFRIAASILILVTAGLIFSQWSAPPAYALQEVFARFHEAHSFYISGVLYSPWSSEETPTEIYVRRPSTFWSTRIHFAKLNSEVIRHCTGYRASNGLVRYQHRNESVEEEWNWMLEPFAEEDHPIWSQIELEMLLSKTIGRDVFQSSPSDFELIGRQEHAGTACDVFERRRNVVASSSQNNGFHRILVDPISRVPVAVVSGVRNDDTGHEKLMWKIDKIELDPFAIPEHIHVEPPPGTEIAATRPPIERFDSRLYSVGTEVHVPFALKTQAGALLCWANRDNADEPSSEDSSLGPLNFSFVGPDGTDRASQTRELGKTHDGTTLWTWVLVEFSGDGIEQPEGGIRVSYKLNHKNHGEREIGRRLLPVDIGKVGIRKVLEIMSASSGEVTIDAILEDSHTLLVPQA